MPPCLGVYFLGTPELLTRLATRVKNQLSIEQFIKFICPIVERQILLKGLAPHALQPGKHIINGES